MTTASKQLIGDCLRGDRLAQERFYDLHKTKMYGVCLRFASNQSEAEDILMEGFFKVFRDLHQFKNQCPLEAWVRQVIVNSALMHLRKKHRNIIPSVDLEEVSNGLLVTDDDFPSQMEAQAVIALIQQLPLGFQTVFNLFAIEGFSHREIAEELDISESTSRSQYARARSALQKLIVREGIVR